MGGDLEGALKLADAAKLLPMPLSVGGARIVRGFFLEYGPQATADEIATLACRRLLQLADESSDESAVARLVHANGFTYVPSGWSLSRVPASALAS